MLRSQVERAAERAHRGIKRDARDATEGLGAGLCNFNACDV